MDFKREFSAGCVVYKREKNKLFFLLGKHSGYHKWVFPKGLIEAGEKSRQTALRETEEEMGIEAKLIDQKPIHIEKYVYTADLKKEPRNFKTPIRRLADQNAKQNRNTRRVRKYEEEGGGKTKVFKTVTFYLAKYESGESKDHGWEMEDAGWFVYDKALKLLAFKGEREALKKAVKIIKINKDRKCLF